ncbi:MAG: hypothetical protein ACK5XV_11850 [Flavobacteriales bacterium]|jgi:hypothetical protein
MKSLLPLLFTCITLYSCAQQNDQFIGVRGGFGSGVTYQHYLDPSRAIEVIAYSRWQGLSMTGLYQFHKPLFDVEGMKWYYGAGAHAGFFRYREDGPRWHDEEWDGTRVVIGADAILGLEYFFDELPLQFSLDWKPAINVIGHSGFWGDEGAFSIRYSF